jgi:phosphoglycerate-specific signal transduction histidine kinase
VKHVFQVVNNLDVYEILIEGTIVYRITRFTRHDVCGEDIEFVKLNETVQHEIIKHVHESNNH